MEETKNENQPVTPQEPEQKTDENNAAENKKDGKKKIVNSRFKVHTKTVAVISETRGFMLEAICSNIEKTSSLIAKRVLADVGAIPDFWEETDIIVLYLEDSHKYLEKLYVNLDKMFEKNKKNIPLFLTGSPEQITLAKKKLRNAPIGRIFNRPINVKELVEELDFLAHDKNFQVRKRILVVDDDPVMLATLQGWLSKRYMYYSVNSGNNAINFLSNHEVDLILLDYDMPGYNGPDTLRMIRQKDKLKKQPVMFLTSRNDRESVLSIKNLGVERYLLKSLPNDEILDSIQDFFDK